MPVYDYACGACGRVTEVIHGINDHGPRFCPECGTEGSMRKTMTAPAVVFKGAGWAKLDRRSSRGTRASGGTASKAGPEAGGAGAGSPAEGSSTGSAPTEPAKGGGTASTSDGGGD